MKHLQNISEIVQACIYLKTTEDLIDKKLDVIITEFLRLDNVV